MVMPKAKPGQRLDKPLFVLFQPKEREALDKLSRTRGVSRSSLIREATREWLARETKKAPA